MSRNVKELKKVLSKTRDLNLDVNSSGYNNHGVGFSVTKIPANSKKNESEDMMDSMPEIANLNKSALKMSQMDLSFEDHDLIATLKSKLEVQRKELEQRYESLTSIQRNFDSLSQLYQTEVEKSKELNEKLQVAENKMREYQDKMNEMELDKNQIQLLHIQYREIMDKK
jgi:methyl-accepting chemotaxis protein